MDCISIISDIRENNKLLYLGCGPGIYAEMFHDTGFIVTEIDYSRRSIEYATEQAKNSFAKAGECH
ncbi:methyltransferase domain-containing protein [Fontibacillus panacisegetis]|nr:methyltransferase domain-containing protein [Fontibacillus solani]